MWEPKEKKTSCKRDKRLLVVKDKYECLLILYLMYRHPFKHIE